MLVLSVYILVFLRIGVTSRSWNTFFNLHFFSKYTLCLEFWNFENFLLGKTHHYIDFWKVKHIFLWIWGLFSSFLLLAWTNVAIWDSRGEQTKEHPPITLATTDLFKKQQPSICEQWDTWLLGMPSFLEWLWHYNNSNLVWARTIKMSRN